MWRERRGYDQLSNLFDNNYRKKSNACMVHFFNGARGPFKWNALNGEEKKADEQKCHCRYDYNLHLALGTGHIAN